MEAVDLLRFLISLLFVLALMGGLWLFLRKLGLNGPMPLTPAARRRLKIVEILPLDPRRKAIILRKDDKEHLVILGPTGETVVESGYPVKIETDES